jgi:hypothetical protein
MASKEQSRRSAAERYTVDEYTGLVQVGVEAGQWMSAYTFL